MNSDGTLNRLKEIKKLKNNVMILFLLSNVFSWKVRRMTLYVFDDFLDQWDPSTTTVMEEAYIDCKGDL